MPFAYRIYDQHEIYFVTFTVRQWVDVLPEVSILKFC
jgi:hypothetical protein